MTRKPILLAGASVLAIAMTPQGALADGDRMKPSYEELENRVETLEQRLDEKEAADQKATSLKEPTDVQWTFKNLRPTVTTGDGAFQMSIRGRFQGDWASYFQDDFGPLSGVPAAERDLSGGAVVRRAYLGVEGKAWNDFWYELRVDFGGSGTESSGVLNLARIAWHPHPDWRLNVGVIEPIFTYNQSVSSTELLFVERASVQTIAVSEFGGDSGRRGIELTYQHTDQFWEGDNIVVSGALTGQKTASTDTLDETTNILGRVAWRLWSDGVSNLQIGGSAAKVLDYEGAAAVTARFRDRPESRVDGDIRLVDTSFAQGANAMRAESQWLYSFEAGLNIENVYVGGEYYEFGIDRDFFFPSGSTQEPEFSGWYLEGAWAVVGGPFAFSTKSSSNGFGAWGAPSIKKPFAWGESIGAVDVAVRYSTVNLNFNEGAAGVAVAGDGVRGGEQEIWTFAVNWYLNPNMRVMADFQDITVDKLNAAGDNAGQDLNAVIGRMQFTF